MAITTIYAPAEFTLASGSGDVLPVPFTFLDDSHLDVFLNDVLLVLGDDYTISGSSVVMQTGTAGDTVKILLDVPVTQLSQYLKGDTLDPEIITTSLDKLTLIAQVLSRLLDSTVRAPDGEDADLPLPVAVDRANRVQAYDADGDTELLTYAQLLALLELEIPTGVVDRPTTTFANAAGRAAATADFTGQVAVQLDNGTLWRAASTGAGDWVRVGELPSIVEYGAVPDDQSVDNAFAIRAALTATGGAWIPPGTWYCSTEVSLADGESGLSVFGAGRGTSTLKLADNIIAADFRFFRNTTLSFDQVSNCRFQGFTLDCNGGNQPGTHRVLGITLSGRGLLGRDLEVKNFRGGSAGEGFVMYFSDRESGAEGPGSAWINCVATDPAGYSDAEVELTIFHVGALTRPVDVSSEDVQLASSAFDGATNTITSTAHGLNDGDVVWFDEHEGAGTLPTGIQEDTPYYVTGATTNTFQIAGSDGPRAQALDFDADATGNVYYIKENGDSAMLSAVNGAILGCALYNFPVDNTTHRYSYKGFSVGGRGLVCLGNRAHNFDGTVVWLNSFYGYHRNIRISDNSFFDVKVGISVFCNDESARYRSIVIEDNSILLGLTSDVPNGSGRQDLLGVSINLSKDADGSGFIINALRDVIVRNNTIEARNREFYDAQSSAVGKVVGILLRAQTVGVGFSDWRVEDNRIIWGKPGSTWGSSDFPILVQVNEDVFEPDTLPDKIQFIDNRLSDGSLISPVIQDSTSGTVEYCGPPVSVPQFINSRFLHDDFLAALADSPWASTLSGGMTLDVVPGSVDDCLGAAQFGGLTTTSAARYGIMKQGGGIVLPAGGMNFDLWISCKIRRTAVDRKISFHTDDVDLGSDTITVVGHGFSDGEIVRIEAFGTPIVPLAEGTDYYIVNSTADTFQLEATPAGGAINLTGLGSSGTFNRFIGERSSFAFGLVDGNDLESTSKKGVLLGCMRTGPKGTGGDNLRRLVGMVGNGASAYEWEILGDESESQNGDWLEGTIMIPGDLSKVQFTLRKTWQSAQYTRNTRTATSTNLPTGVTLYPAILCSEQINNATGSARLVEADWFSLQLVPRRVS